ncbi:hypothetical protein [Aeromonas sp. 6P]|uniref:hypothetical protein n=1 Tax=Aeromonas sp. 6P TaxID=3452722 RepID=UPI003F78DF5D
MTVLRCSYCNESEGHLDTCPFTAIYAKSCPHCGKTDFDNGAACYAPQVSSPAAGDWVCVYSSDNAPDADLDPYECRYCGCIGGHVDGCVSVDPDLDL